MKLGRWILIGVVVAVVVTIIESLVHGILLKELYVQSASVWRPEAEMSKLVYYGWVATLISCFFLVYIFHKGYEGKPNKILEGLRFGAVIGLFYSIPMAAWSYITIPMPFALALAWFAVGFVDMLIAGVIISLLYKRA